MDGEENAPTVPNAPGSGPSVPTTSTLAQPNTQRKATSGFTNLQSYFNANKNNNLANTIVAPQEQNIQKATQNLGESKAQFDADTQAAQQKLQDTKALSQQAIGYIDTGANSLAPVSLPADATAEQKAKAATDSNKAAQDALLKTQNYQYTGPKELKNQQDLLDQQFQLKDFSKASKDDTGRGAILQTMFGRGGNYTAGARNLDNFLLGADQNNLKRLKDIRSQTQGFDQNLQRFATDADANVAAMQGQVNLTKQADRSAMQELRNRMKQRLEQDALQLNAANRADADTVTTEELRQWIPEMTGYDLVGDPNVPTSVAAGDMNLGVLPEDAAAVDPTTLNWLNLMNNREFTDYEKVDPNRGVSRDIKESGGFGHRDWTHSSVGKPNANDSIININALNADNPLFSEAYTDNTWDSLDPDSVIRRNVLTDVLGDNFEGGTITPKQKQEIEVKMNNELLDKLKLLPKRAEEAYLTDFYTNAPGNISNTLSRYKELGYTNVADLMRDMNVSMSVGRTPGLGVFGVGNTNNFFYNPKTGLMEYNSFLGRRSMTPEELNSKLIHGKGGFDNTSSPGLIANKTQEVYLRDRLKELLNIKPEDLKVKRNY